MLTWHEAEFDGSTNTDVFYVAKDPSAPTWPTKSRVAATSGKDQFQPAFDNDSAGNVLITYLDRRNSATNLQYQEFGVYINPAGSLPPINGPFAVNTTQTNPDSFGDFVGDYQDVWLWNFSDSYGTGARWNTGWAGIGATTGYPEVYVSGIR